MTSSQSYLDEAIEIISGFEGRAQWMYLDTVGIVTVGVGQALLTPSSALSYPFQRPNAEFATREEILAEYATVKVMPPGRVAKAYRRSTSLLLADTAIDDKLRESIQNCVADLLILFPKFDGFPDAAKLGLIDMTFNLGITKIRRGYPNFCGFVRQEMWKEASPRCHRIGPSEERNAWTANQFLLAAKAADAVTEHIA
jgi:GH24 family phage-related lysozyme (muramidase)